MAQLPLDFNRRESRRADTLAESSDEATPLAETEDVAPKIKTVSELQRELRNELERRYRMVLVSGELSGFSIHAQSGHAYFNLKDEAAQIRCVMWRDSVARLRFQPKDGLEVVIRGKVTIYERGGNLQLSALSIDPVGLGALQQEFLEVVARLRAQGFFAEERKRVLPRHPEVIGIVTSKHGAALRDIVRTLLRRNPRLSLIFSHTSVQGRDAADEIAAAIRRLDQLGRADVVLLARGGGSLEDLWGFNSEKVAQAILECRVPVVTGIGHETDNTIADLVADLRASTPTAAAEHVSPTLKETSENLSRLAFALERSLRRAIQQWQYQLLLLKERVRHPQAILRQKAQRLDELSAQADRLIRLRLRRATERQHQFEHRLFASIPTYRILQTQHRIAGLCVQLQHRVAARHEFARQKLLLLSARLEALGPASVLSRGYAWLETETGEIIRSIEQVQPGLPFKVRLADGQFWAQVLHKPVAPVKNP